MKKIYIFTLILIASFSIKAQYILTGASNPVPGDIDIQYQVTNTLVPLGSSGSGQTWDYSTVAITWSTVSTASYIAMSSVPNASLFPTGTIAVGSPSSCSVYENTSSVSRYLGYANTSPTNCMVYSNPMTNYTLPFGFGSSSIDTYSYTQGITVNNGTITTTGDGNGTLKTPGMIFPNVLKIRYNATQTAITGTVVSTVNYIFDNFYSSVNKFPLFAVLSGTISSSTSSTSIVAFARVNAYAFVGIQETIQETDFSIYPNPTSGKEVTINFNTNESENYSVKITNTIGQEVKNIELPQMAPGQHSSAIDLQGLNSGIYFIKLKNKTGESIRKLVIE